MSDITRYFWGEYGMDKDPDGDYVDAEEYDRLTAQLAELQNKFERCNQARAESAKEAEHNQRMWDGSARRVGLLESQLAERDEAAAQKVIERARLADENATLRAEVERLKSVDCSTCAGREITEIITYTRKRTAQEIVDMLRSDRWAESELRGIIYKFGLEGVRDE